MAALLPLAYADVGSPLADKLFATDAMGSNQHDFGGYAVVGAKVPMDSIIKAYMAGSAPNIAICNLNGDLGRYTRQHKPLIPTVPITRLSPDLFNKAMTHWEPIKFGRWLYEDHITLGEGRATLHLLQALALLSKAHRHKVISLEDNLAWGCSAAKGRSPSIALNKSTPCQASSAMLIVFEVRAMTKAAATSLTLAEASAILPDAEPTSAERLAIAVRLRPKAGTRYCNTTRKMSKNHR